MANQLIDLKFIQLWVTGLILMIGNGGFGDVVRPFTAPRFRFEL